jgi:hypothetical protein
MRQHFVRFYYLPKGMSTHDLLLPEEKGFIVYESRTNAPLSLMLTYIYKGDVRKLSGNCTCHRFVKFLVVVSDRQQVATVLAAFDG